MDGVDDVEILGHGRGVYVVQIDEAEMMVAMAWSIAFLCGEGARPELLATAASFYRTRARRLATNKNRRSCQGVRKGEGGIGGQESAAGSHCFGRNRRNSAAARRSFDGKIRQPGGMIRRGGRG